MRCIMVLLIPLLLALTMVNATSIPGMADWKDGVVVIVYGQQYGTGFWVNDEYVVTAAHVVGYNLHDVAAVIKGDWRSDALVVYVNEKTDVAILKVRNPTMLHYTFKIASKTVAKKDIYVVGYPYEIVQLSGDLEAASTTPRVAKGFSAWHRPELYLLEFQATTDAGNSGGPVVYSNGAVVGVVSFALAGKVGVLYFATTAEALKHDLKLAGVSFEEADPPEELDVSKLDITEKKVTIIASVFSILLAILYIYVYLGGGRSA